MGAGHALGIMTLAPFPVTQTAAPDISRIGRFYITHELGRGAIGVVYLAHDPVIDRDVAIKTFSARLDPFQRKQYEQQFISEARAAGRLSHPGIVTIYDASSEGGSTYIAMEYLQGRGLNRMLDKGHRFRPDDIVSIIWKLADALDHAHKHGVIHRDIKPANIFMVGDHQPKIVDFGIARSPNRLSDQPAHNINQPHTLFCNNLLGTPNYMSPEQALSRSVDERTDVYSLGAVMYEMLTGRQPFHSTDTDQLLQTIAYKAPPAPHDIDPQVPVALSHIVMKAMSKRPEKRYQAAGDMVLDLKRYLMREKRIRQRKQASDLAPEQAMLAEAMTNVAGGHKLFAGLAVAGTIGILAAAMLFWLR